MDKFAFMVVHSYKGIVHSKVHKLSIVICDADEFHKHHLEGKKVDIKEYVPYFIYINFKVR